MNKPALLLFDETWERLLNGELDHEFEIIRLWQSGDPDSTLSARGGEVIATLTTHIDAGQLDRLPDLRLIAVPGAGYENISVDAARARAITVANSSDTHSADVADHAVALTLASVHRLLESQEWVREGRWSTDGLPERRRAMLAQRFGIVGLGNIGTAIAERLAPFGGEYRGGVATTSRRPGPAETA